MQIDYIIVGQGICGSFLSYYLEKEGQKILVIDESRPNSPSKVASGVINPFTGRRIVKTWLIDKLLPFAREAYTSLGESLNSSLIRSVDILDFHPTLQMKEAFENRSGEESEFLEIVDQEESWSHYFRFLYGIGKIRNAQLVELPLLLSTFREKLRKQNCLLEENFDFSRFHPVENFGGISYQGFRAKKIIFCDGVSGFDNPYFQRLPFVRTKGEALIAEIPDLPDSTLFKQGITIVPWKKGLFWIGSSYEWNYSDPNPTAAFRNKTEAHLDYWLKLPFKIVDHLAAERPANVERRPFVGLHPHFPTIGILNGMGTKGCSLAPYFAYQLSRNLLQGIPVNPLADVQRFAKTLLR